MSKLTLKEMGMMLDSKRICLKMSKSQYYPNPPQKTMMTAKTHMKANRTLAK
jgi:hypothetical protein